MVKQLGVPVTVKILSKLKQVYVASLSIGRVEKILRDSISSPVCKGAEEIRVGSYREMVG